MLRAAGRKSFMPFITAGDPDPAFTTRLIETIASAGADLIEIGFPFSDPIADGPVVQASYTRALDRGLKVAQVFDCIRAARVDIPLVGMASYTLIHRKGPAAFLDAAKSAGLSGLIVPDLPIEEAEALAKLSAERDLKLVLLVTPLTPPERAVRIAKLSTGFLYCVSVSGITGERDRLPEELAGRLNWLRSQSSIPLCVGFGVSRPEQVRQLREVADGVIVGSAIVRKLERVRDDNRAAVLAEIAGQVRELSNV
jgi:tryptophan synthase alpha chain